jgi:hypothetical protein
MQVNMDEYLIIDTGVTSSGDTISKIRSFDDNGKIFIKQYSGVNTDNFVISKADGKKVSFSFFTTNGIYYINLNGEHIMDYNKFINIKKFSYNTTENYLKISNNHFGDIYVHNCDVDIFKKALIEMASWMKNKTSFVSNLLYYIFS